MTQAALFIAALGLISAAYAEQLLRFGDIEAHYVVLASTRIKPEIAEQHGIVRGHDRALVNIALRDTNIAGNAMAAAIPGRLSGTATNLLGQVTELRFREVREDEAIYYLAMLLHTDEEIFRFDSEIRIQGQAPQHLRFQQKLYVE